MRCNFVDLYYELFGMNAPAVLSRSDSSITMGLPRIPKLSKRALSPTEFSDAAIDDRRISVDSDRHFSDVMKIKDEMLDRDDQQIENGKLDYRNNDNDGDSRPPNPKRIKSDYGSDNSASLPGMSGGSGPVGFEPGMFKSEDDNSQGWKKADSSRSKSKEKDKDKDSDGASKVNIAIVVHTIILHTFINEHKILISNYFTFTEKEEEREEKA